MSDWNAGIIEEFRANAGRVGGPFEGAPMLLLHTVGRKSGEERVNPLMYQPVGDDIAVFASKGGHSADPHWFLNVEANPSVTVEIGEETVAMTARIATGEERDRIWEAQKRERPMFAEYEQKTTREIPVVVLSRSR